MASNPPRFKLERVKLGDHSVEIPVADIVGARPGKTLVVTGGSDGDEYAGMEAAYELAREFSAKDFAGRLIVVPILNIPGFDDECSQNPFDQKYPKRVSLGTTWGSSSEKLMAWLTATYLRGASGWMDLHAGALTESLRPFVWTWKSGVDTIDTLTQKFMETCGAEIAARTSDDWDSKIKRLAKMGCAYVLTEAGELGLRRREDVERHVKWVKHLMELLEMIAAQPLLSSPSKGEGFARSKIFSHVSYDIVPFDGIWRPVEPFPGVITKGQLLGEVVTLDESRKMEIRASEDGEVLWRKQTMAARKGDVLCATGRG